MLLFEVEIGQTLNIGPQFDLLVRDLAERQSFDDHLIQLIQ